MPGGSPYRPTPESVAELLDLLDRLFARLRQRRTHVRDAHRCGARAGVGAAAALASSAVMRVLMLKDALPNGGAERQLALLVQVPADGVGAPRLGMAGGPFVEVIEAGGHRVEVAERADPPRPAAGRLPVEAHGRAGVPTSSTRGTGCARWQPCPLCRLLRIPLIDGDIRSGIAHRARPGAQTRQRPPRRGARRTATAGLMAWGVGERKGTRRVQRLRPRAPRLCRRERRRDRPFTVVMTGRMAPAEGLLERHHGRAGTGRPRRGAWRFVLVGSGPDEGTAARRGRRSRREGSRASSSTGGSRCFLSCAGPTSAS